MILRSLFAIAAVGAVTLIGYAACSTRSLFDALTFNELALDPDSELIKD